MDSSKNKTSMTTFIGQINVNTCRVSKLNKQNINLMDLQTFWMLHRVATSF